MPNTPGDAPFLQRTEMTRLVQTNTEEVYEAGMYPIQRVFMRGNKGELRLVGSSKFLIEFEEAVRKIGNWTSRPGDPTPFEYAKIGLMTAQVGFGAVKDELPADHDAAFREPGQPMGSDPSPGSLAARGKDAAMRWLNKVTKKGVAHHLRKLEWASTQNLTTASYTLVVDGVDVTVSTGVTLGVCPGGVAWTSASADIPGDLGEMEVEFIEEAGGPPDLVIYSYMLGKELAANDDVRDISKRGLAGSKIINTLENAILPAGMQDIEIIRETDSYTDSDGDNQPMWPHYIVTMMRLGMDPENVVDAVTVPTRAEEYTGGMWSASAIDPLTQKETVAVGFNGVTLTLDRSRIKSWDVSSV